LIDDGTWDFGRGTWNDIVYDFLLMMLMGLGMTLNNKVKLGVSRWIFD
jgi:hypothetical protein